MTHQDAVLAAGLGGGPALGGACVGAGVAWPGVPSAASVACAAATAPARYVAVGWLLAEPRTVRQKQRNAELAPL